MPELNETPSANRLHIGIFGKTNSGKSSFINAFTNQAVSIVADVAGTTTDPVYKAMELHPLGPCEIIDTAGFDDVSELGEKRVEKTRLAAEKSDIAVIVISATQEDYEQELSWCEYFKLHHTPVLIVLNKTDLSKKTDVIIENLTKKLKEQIIPISAKSGEGIQDVKTEMIRLIPENHGQRLITGNLVAKSDLVLLVMPQDIQAPKGRLILPQVQTIRELLDRQCMVMCVTTDQLEEALRNLTVPPKLIITDSQIFRYVFEHKPRNSMLTSFSVLFAAYKGDLPYYLEGAKMLDALTGHSRVLIAECCSHAPLEEDIGRVKLPRMLRKRVGEELTVDIVSGTDFPEDLSDYDLIIQCGACMFNRKYVMSRIDCAKKQSVPMTNYGVAIAHLTGIIEHIIAP